MFQVKATDAKTGQTTTYRIPINTHSIKGGNGKGSDVQYSVGVDRQDEPFNLEAEAGLTQDVHLSYVDLGLKQTMFRSVGEGELNLL